MPVFTVTVSGVEYGIAPDSLSITEVLKQRSTCDFRVPDTASAFDFKVGMPVYVYDAVSNVMFGGTIDQPQWYVESGTNIKFWQISCIDWNHLPEKRTTLGWTWTNKTLGYIVKDMVIQGLIGDGIDTSLVQDGPTLAEFSTSYEYVSEKFTELANLAGASTNSVWQWNIDYTKKLRFFAPNTYAAPVALTGLNCRANTIRCRETREDYWNRVTVRLLSQGSVAIVYANDVAGQLARSAIEGGAGLYEKLITLSDATTLNEAQALADAELTRSKGIARVMTLETREEGLQVGQVFTLAITGYGTASSSQSGGMDIEDGLEYVANEAITGTPYDAFEYLIRTIRTYDEQGQVLWRQVEGIWTAGALPLDYIDYFREMRNTQPDSLSVAPLADIVVTPAPDGINSTFAAAKSFSMLLRNGSIQRLTVDYTVSGLAIEFNAFSVPLAGDRLWAQ